MRAIAADVVVAWCEPCTTAEAIEMQTRMGPKNHLEDGFRLRIGTT